MRLALAVASKSAIRTVPSFGADLLVDSAAMTADDQNQHVTNSVRDVDGTVVQAKHIGSLTVRGHQRAIVPLGAIFCVVLAIGGFITWRLWPQDEQPSTGDPLAAASSLDGSCDSTGWVAPHQGDAPIKVVDRPPGAVAASGHSVIVTLQGLTDMKVVLQSMKAEVLNRKPAASGVHLPGRCGGGLIPRFFAVDLSAAAPTAVPREGNHGEKTIAPVSFPFTIVRDDVEQFIVEPSSPNEEVEWVLLVRWTAGARSGELRIDDQGTPFRTTAITAARKWCMTGGGDEWRPSCE